MKPLTHGPLMDFPRFDGTNPSGWIGQADRYFQMAWALPEVKIYLAQLYFVGKVDV